MSKLQKLIDERKTAIAAAEVIQATAKDEDRDLTDDEQASVETHVAGAKAARGEIDKINAKRDAQNKLELELAAEAALDKQVTPRISAPPKPGTFATPTPASSGAPEPEAPSLGEFLQAVAFAGDPSNRGEPMAACLTGAGSPMAAISGHNEGVGSAGGFLVGTDSTTNLMQRVYNNTVLLSGGDGFPGAARIPISSSANGMKINSLNETSRADGSRWGGIRAFWLEEAGTKTASQAEFKQISLELKKLIGLSYATDELLQDASALEAVISAAFEKEFSFKLQDALYNGTGAGLPLGILNAPATVSVAKEAGQAALTIVKKNIDNMWSRMWPSSLPNSVWLINQNCYPALFDMTQAVGTGGAPVYLPPGGLSGSPFGTLMGRPVVPIEQCQTLGTKGDIAFVDMSEYLYADKGTMQSASSIHVRFIYDETVFRFVHRCDGRPGWNAALTPFKDSAAGSTVSPFIVLDTRS